MKTYLIAAFFAVFGLAAQASTLDFTFSFANDPSGTGGTVTGIVRGLMDDTANQQATSVEVLTNTLGFGIGEYIGSPSTNIFSVANGAITTVDFLSFGVNNTAPSVTTASLALVFGQGFVRGPGLFNFDIVVSYTGLDLTFTPVAAVPLPAGALLLLTSLGGLAIARRKRAA